MSWDRRLAIVAILGIWIGFVGVKTRWLPGDVLLFAFGLVALAIVVRQALEWNRERMDSTRRWWQRLYDTWEILFTIVWAAIAIAIVASHYL